MKQRHAVGTQITKQISISKSGDQQSNEEKGKYRVIVGSFLYLACSALSDIAFAVSALSRFISDPGFVHVQAAKGGLLYLEGTNYLGLKNTRPAEDMQNRLSGSVDSDSAGCLDTLKSTTGYVLMLNGTVILHPTP